MKGRFYTLALMVRYDISGPDHETIEEGVTGYDVAGKEYPIGSYATTHVPLWAMPGDGFPLEHCETVTG